MRSMGPHGWWPSDKEAVKGKTLQRALVKRVWWCARPYRRMLIAYLITIVGEGTLVLTPPLLVKRLFDVAIPGKDTGMVTTLGLIMIGVAFADAVLSLIERWWSSRIGEGVIYDLRVSLFDHTQRMPIAFFTRTQTGALISRMNNDVIGAQRALTGTLGSVVSNVVTLSLTLVAMAWLSWQLTVLAVLLLPLFLLPAKRI